MSQWTDFFTYFQVFYLIVVMVALTIYTLILFFEKMGFNSDELYEEYVVSRPESYIDTAIPSKHEIMFHNWISKGVIIAVLPACFFIYRSRLLSLTAFKNIKMHQGRRKGIAYNQTIQVMNNMFLLSRLRDLNYIQYITFKNRRK